MQQSDPITHSSLLKSNFSEGNFETESLTVPKATGSIGGGEMRITSGIL